MWYNQVSAQGLLFRTLTRLLVPFLCLTSCSARSALCNSVKHWLACILRLSDLSTASGIILKRWWNHSLMVANSCSSLIPTWLSQPACSSAWWNLQVKSSRSPLKLSVHWYWQCVPELNGPVQCLQVPECVLFVWLALGLCMFTALLIKCQIFLMAKKTHQTSQGTLCVFSKVQVKQPPSPSGSWMVSSCTHVSKGYISYEF